MKLSYWTGLNIFEAELEERNAREAHSLHHLLSLSISSERRPRPVSSGASFCPQRRFAARDAGRGTVDSAGRGPSGRRPRPTSPPGMRRRVLLSVRQRRGEEGGAKGASDLKRFMPRACLDIWDRCFGMLTRCPFGTPRYEIVISRG